MRCLYEVLGVDRTAEDDVIKKAYRKAALVWHPDKNQHRLEEADVKFKEIQNAYEVLSDKHERAWYDSHREQILKSGERHQAGAGGDWGPGMKPDDEIDLFQYFSSSCYSGFGDGPKGFYGVYSELFKTLAEQELSAWEQTEAAGSKGATAPSYPGFGSSDSPAAEVYAFYGAWTSFVTYKDFAWADPYNPATAPNRQVRRRMEDENKKARRVQRREYLDNVRELVAFVKKRDKRMAKFQAEEATRRAEQQAAEAARRAAEREERLRRAAEYQEPEWVRASEAVASDSEDDDYQEEEQQQHYCIVCEKRFKSAGQLANHERSKAHRETLAALQEVLQEEEAWLLNEQGNDVQQQGGAEPLQQQQQPPQEQHQHAAPGRKGKGKKKKKQQRWQQQQQQSQITEEALSSDDDVDPGQQPQQQLDGAAANGSFADAAAEASHESSCAEDDELQHEIDSHSEQDNTDSEGGLDEDELLARLVSQTRGSSRPSSSKGQQRTAAAKAAGAPNGDASASALDADVAEAEASDSSGGSSHSRQGESEAVSEESDEDAMLARLAASRINKSSRNKSSSKQQATQQDEIAAAVESELDGFSIDSSRSGKGSRKKKGKAAAAGAAVPASSKVTVVPPSSNGAPASAKFGNSEDSSSDEEGPLRGRGSKAAAKADKRKQRQARKAQAEAAASGMLCQVCGSVFDSRSKLFKHIAAEGHAAPK